MHRVDFKVLHWHTEHHSRVFYQILSFINGSAKMMSECSTQLRFFTKTFLLKNVLFSRRTLVCKLHHTNDHHHTRLGMHSEQVHILHPNLPTFGHILYEMCPAMSKLKRPFVETNGRTPQAAWTPSWLRTQIERPTFPEHLSVSGS